MTTVPPAVSQVSENPSGNAVVSATNPKQKAAGVDRQMRFFGVIQAFREGRYPDNKQIDDTLKYTLANSPVDLNKLSPDGKKLIQDVRELIETSRQIVVNKNAGEEFQNFLYATRKADVAGQINVKAPVSGEDAKKDGETAAEAFRTLLTLFLRNGEMRKLIEDLGYIGRDMFADGAAKAAEVARPDEERLAKVDEPAPDNEFHDDLPDVIKKRQEAKQQANEAADQAKEVGKDHAQDVANAHDPNASDQQNKENVQEAAKQKANLLANKVSEKIPQKHRDMAVEQKDKAVDYVKEKFPQERRDQFYYRLKKVVVECQRHNEYQDAIEYFLNFFEQYKSHASHVAGQAADAGKNVRSEGNVATAETTFRRLIERFANGAPTQPIIDAVDQLYTDAANDPELKGWFRELDQYIRKCLQEPGYIMKDEANTKAKQLTESGKKFFVAADGRSQGKYVGHKDAVTDEIIKFAKAMHHDPLNRKLSANIQTITKDLFLNADGGLTFKPHLWSDIRDPILPELLSHIGVVPLPRIEYTDKQVDLVIENLTIDLLNILPSQTELDIRNHFKLSQFNKLGDKHQHSFKLTLHQIQTDMRDVHFVFRKKVGFPRLNERGTADVFLGGNGLTVTVHIEASNTPAGQRSRHIFQVKSVVAKVDKLKFAIRDSKHDTLIKVLKPLATSIIKKQVAKAAEQGIRDGLEDLDRQLVQLRDRIERNKEIEGKGIGDAVKETFGKTEEEKKAHSDATFKLATSKRNSILPNLGHPDGWIQKVDERDAAAKAPSKTEKDWYSPAFTIVQPGQKNPKNTESAKAPASAALAASAGAAGAAGSTAYKGTTGVTGAQGAQGAQGTAGHAGAAGAAGVAGAAGAAGVAAAATHGAGQPGQTSSAYTTANGSTAPGALASGTNTTAPAVLPAGTGATAVYPGGVESGNNKPAASETQPINPAFKEGHMA